MKTILITKDIKVAKYAENSGVDRIMVDLEILGKNERQGHLNTVISKHTIEDVKIIRKVLNNSKLLVRINPINPNSKEEIKRVIESGADILMLPMFSSPEEVQFFVENSTHKVKKMLLLETPQALARIDDILEIKGVDEIHIGLNDLHLGMNLDFMFELLSGGIVEYLSKKIKAKGITFGFGGIARVGQGQLDSSLILSEHLRLGSEIVILSRDFKGGAEKYEELIEKIDLKAEVLLIKRTLKMLSLQNVVKLLENKKKLKEKVKKILLNKKNG